MSDSIASSRPVVAPVQQTERVQIVDILRGFALFGILFVNMIIFSHPSRRLSCPPTHPCPGWTAPRSG